MNCLWFESLTCLRAFGSWTSATAGFVMLGHDFGNFEECHFKQCVLKIANLRKNFKFYVTFQQ